MKLLLLIVILLTGCTSTPTAHSPTITVNAQPSETAMATSTATVTPSPEVVNCMLEVFHLEEYRHKFDFACPAQLAPTEVARNDGLICYLEKYQDNTLFWRGEINCPGRLPITQTPEP